MENIKQQVVERLKQANNILVTVRNDPSVDLLSACIGLSLVLGKLNKHAAAVFSGEVPSVMEFLKPEKTLEATPDSLRDFIIALDKAKADKLRYKVEDKVVRIFITPYKTSLSQDDLEFSQGDFNIDVVVALGAHQQQELDQAITQHGRILHDATVISINNTADGNLGSLNWQQPDASAVSEMVADLAKDLGKDLLDEQIATALLTGIVAETARFSNDKTTPATMTLAGVLMAAGANQQLVANELQSELSQPAAEPTTVAVQDTTEPASKNTTLDITHEVPAEPAPSAAPAPETKPEPEAAPKAPGREILPMPDPGHLGGAGKSDLVDVPFTSEFADGDGAGATSSYLIDQAASQAASSEPSIFDKPHTDAPLPLTPPVAGAASATPAPGVAAGLAAEPVPAADTPPAANVPTDTAAPAEPTPSASAEPPADATVADTTPTVDDARNQVLEALKQSPGTLEPVAALNAQPMVDPMHTDWTMPTPLPAEPYQPANPMPPILPHHTAIEIDADGALKPAAPITVNLNPMPSPAADAPADDTPAMDMPLPPVADVSLPGQAPPSKDQAGKKDTPPPVPPPFLPPNSL